MVAGTILLAEDEITVRRYIVSVLRTKGFQLLEAADGMEALEQLEKRSSPIDLLLTDICMPRMDGIALARCITAMHPGTPVIYISGFSFDVATDWARDRQRPCAFLAKPFPPDTLLEAVHKCLNTREDATNGD